MTADELEKLLYDYPSINKRIGDLTEELNDTMRRSAELSETILGGLLKSTVIDGMPKGGGLNNPTERAVEALLGVGVKFNSHVQYLLGSIGECFEAKAKVDKLLSLLNANERDIIKLRYFKRFSWRIVSNMLHYSDRQCRRIEQSALTKMLA